MKIRDASNGCDSCGRVIERNDARWGIIYPTENELSNITCLACMEQPLRVLKAAQQYLANKDPARAQGVIQEFADQVDEWENTEPEPYP